MKIGYQLYSAREEAARDLEGTLKALKEIGYDGIEFAGFYGHEAAEVKEILDRVGLEAVSHHVPFADMRADFDKVLQDNKTIGVSYIAVPYLQQEDRPGEPGFAAAVRDIAALARKAKENGLQMLYHNHDFEFAKVSGMYGLDFLYEAVPAEVLMTELDTCWVRYAGEDPAAYIRKYAGRCDIVHLKDYVGRKEEGKTPYALIGLNEDEKKAGEVPFEFRPVGYGCQDVPALVSAARESGAKWLVVEQDMSVGCGSLEAARMSFDTVKPLI